MTQVLTYQEVLEAGRLALAEGRLLAANADVSHETEYGYRVMNGGIESVCIVGAALNDETLTDIDDTNAHKDTVSMLKDRGLVAFNSEDDFKNIDRLQSLHDSWLGSIERSIKHPAPGDIEMVKAAREDFLKRLNSDV